jgi:hypothetical protein
MCSTTGVQKVWRYVAYTCSSGECDITQEKADGDNDDDDGDVDAEPVPSKLHASRKACMTLE